MVTKICTKCNSEKPLSDFTKTKRGFHNTSCVCKLCFSNARLRREYIKPDIVQNEIWKLLPFSSKYSISNLGRLKSNQETIIDSNGVSRNRRERLMRITTDKAGYKYIVLRDNNKMKQTLRIHRLVASAFIPNPENLPIINHKDLNKSNNNVENLEWCTQLHNIRDFLSKSSQVYAHGEQSGASKLTNEEVLEIRRIKSSYKIGYRKLAKLFNVTDMTVIGIVKRKTWKHI